MTELLINKTTTIFIVMEYWEGGDISQLIKKWKLEGQHIPEDQIWKIFTQIVLALREWHRRKEGRILHRDIKPGNLFLDSSNNVKLGDFGLSKIMGKESLYAYTNVGTPYYMSPEQISEEKYDEKSDIWSAGWILYEISSLKPPFEATTQVALAVKIKEGKFSRLPKIYSEELWRVITLMLSPDKEKRPCVDDLLNLPQVSLRLREKRIKDSFAKLKKREEEIKTKEIKMVELESQVLAQLKEIELKNRELEEKDKLLLEKEKEIIRLQAMIEQSKEENTPAPIQSETPKPQIERGCKKYMGIEREVNDSNSVYNSLKQEIRSLRDQASFIGPSSNLRMKKQYSENTDHGYKSVDRQPRKNQESSIDKSLEYWKINWGKDNKENIPPNNKSVIATNKSNEGLGDVSSHYTTPPFKSYKSKMPEKGQERIATTSYRSRSNAYNDSTRSSLQVQQKMAECESRKKYTYKDHFLLRRENN